MVQGVVGRAPGGTGVGSESFQWYRGEGVMRGSRAPPGELACRLVTLQLLQTA